MSLFGKKYEYKVYVDGMSCGHCSARVEAAFNEVKGVSAKVNLEEKTAYVTITENILDSDIKKAIENAGYTVVSIN